jgi:hypothetical protein
LTEDLPSGITFVPVNAAAELFRIQGNTCRYFRCDSSESVVAIHKGNNQYKSRCHVLAKNVGGRFSSIEEIEGKSVFSFVRKIQGCQTNQARLKEAVKFAAQCMTAVKANLPAATRRGEHTVIRNNTLNPSAAVAANAYLADPASSTLVHLLNAIRGGNDVKTVRMDLFTRVMGVLRKQVLHPELTLNEAAEEYQAEFRYKGRPIARRRLIGTTLLLKGLEFDHAIVLEADSLSKKELYVALTRGAKSLTIISKSPVLNPNG